MTRLKSLALTSLLLLLLINRSPAQAQPVSIDSLLTRVLATDELLPLLIDSAIQYSPELRRIAGAADYATANLQVARKAYTSAFSLMSSYNYGTNISAVTNPAVIPGTNNFTTAQTSFYNVGVGMHLPLSYILNRKNIIKSGQSQVNMAVAEKENAALSTRLEVIRLYQLFKLGQRLMTISGKNKQSAQVNYSLIEKDFLNGQTTVEQVSRVLEIYNRAAIEYETYVNNFQTSYMQLEAFTGTNLSALILASK